MPVPMSLFNLSNHFATSALIRALHSSGSHRVVDRLLERRSAEEKMAAVCVCCDYLSISKMGWCAKLMLSIEQRLSLQEGGRLAFMAMPLHKRTLLLMSLLKLYRETEADRKGGKTRSVSLDNVGLLFKLLLSCSFQLTHRELQMMAPPIPSSSMTTFIQLCRPPFPTPTAVSCLPFLLHAFLDLMKLHPVTIEDLMQTDKALVAMLVNLFVDTALSADSIQWGVEVI